VSYGGVSGTLTGAGFLGEGLHGGNTFAQVIIPRGTSGTESPQDTFLEASGARTIVVIQQQSANFFPPNAI